MVKVKWRKGDVVRLKLDGDEATAKIAKVMGSDEPHNPYLMVKVLEGRIDSCHYNEAGQLWVNTWECRYEEV